MNKNSDISERLVTISNEKVITNELMVDMESSTNEAFTLSEKITKIDALSNSESTALSNPWDLAHAAKDQIEEVKFAEPNVDNVYVFESKAFDDTLESTVDVCHRNNDYEADWPFPKNQSGKSINSIWHLGDDYSQLKSARDSITISNNIIRIAHLDTGYDPAQIVYDDKLIRHDLEKNFVEDELPNRAVDNYTKGILTNPGHGTGTLSILAGKQVSLTDYNFNDSIGLSKGIEIVPVRISKRVELFKSANFVKAVDYIISLYDNLETRCHIITMSMGGLASKSWADVVNKAYDKGIFIVTAAGNNIGRLTPRTLIYPARFKRVVAACGVTYGYSPYYKAFDLGGLNIMQGNFGPRKLMRTAIAAFTPNVPWAKIGCGNVVSLAGAGTSSATPQIASAAALYYQKYFKELEKMTEGWMKVEAIRYAMFQSAAKKITSDDNDVELYFGTGVLQAKKMLDIKPEQKNFTEEKKDGVSWPLLRILTHLGDNESATIKEESFMLPIDPELRQMYETEILQLIQQSKELQALLDNEEKEMDQLNEEETQRFKNIILKIPQASNKLKDFLAL